MAPFDVSSCLRAASHHLGPDLSGALHDLTFCVFIEAWSIALPGGIVPLPAARVQCLTKHWDLVPISGLFSWLAWYAAARLQETSCHNLITSCPAARGIARRLSVKRPGSPNINQSVPTNLRPWALGLGRESLLPCRRSDREEEHWGPMRSGAPTRAAAGLFSSPQSAPDVSSAPTVKVATRSRPKYRYSS